MLETVQATLFLGDECAGNLLRTRLGSELALYPAVTLLLAVPVKAR